MHCQKCGKKLKEGETFCSICGYYNSESENDELEERSGNWEIDEVDTLESDVLNADEDEYETIEEDDDDFDYNKDSLVDIVSETDAEDKGNKDFKLKANSSGTKEKEFYYEHEEYLEYYIGEDYKIIKKSPFNIFAFLLNLMYVLYRKLYITGIIGLIISWLFIWKFKKYIIIYVIASLIIIGFGFNKYYIFVSKIKLEKLLKKYEGKDKFELEQLLKKKGGVNVPISLLIYFIFLVCVFFTFVKIDYTPEVKKKFVSENSENQANCISLTRNAYKNIEESTNGKEIVEATCKITVKGQKKDFEIYIKNLIDGKETYSYYKTNDKYIVYGGNTKDLEELEKREKENQISDSDKEALYALRKAKTEYNNIYNDSKEDDELIKEDKNTEEKLNYVVTKEEITR